ncbi:hypothetical protein RN001_007405 [Aquatica leii]|uniref:Uncharacterized protein n=1 Tax=Aquatica leii TaxID=1421715 RepID=A0AAN7PWB3_9COLE|nr:hypothetical protein RN001_007405 [Aquatica leii]
MDIKPEQMQQQQQQQFDISKICRACLTEKGEMRSVFLADESIGQTMRLSEMIMGFSSVQIENGDGLPGSICLQCIHQVSRAFSFKQLCEQSDANLRQYLGKPLHPKPCKQEDDDVSHDIYSSSFMLDNFGLEDSSNDSDDSFKQDFTLLSQMNSENPSDEKAIAQKQLLKAAKLQKCKLTKKKLLAKAGGKASVLKKLKRNTNQCNVCKKQFINLKSFRKHLRTHIEDRPYKCKLCPRGFTEENYLNNHMRTHMPEDQKPYQCKLCNKRFIHTTLLNKHLLKHSGEKPFVCKICNKGCYAENSLLKHMKIHEKKEGDPGLLKHICDYCKSEFPDANTLDVHIKQHTGDRPFLCNMCGKCFPQRFNLELHLRTHTGERPFTCEVCKNGYVSKASLKIHMRTHTNERPFVCDFCGKAFRQSGDLTSHKRLHGTEKPIECSVCQKRFTTVMKLKYHMRNHTGERPYVCSVCGRGFTVNTILLRHLRVHSGERPYVCVTCGKAFSQSSTLNTHMKVHAPSPKYNTQETQSRMPKFSNANEVKFHGTNNQQNNRLLQPTDNRMMQPEPSRMMQQDTTRMISNDGSRIINDAHAITDHRILLNDSARLHLVDVSEPPRLLVNDNTRLLTGTDNRLLTNDNTRLLANMGDSINGVEYSYYIPPPQYSNYWYNQYSDYFSQTQNQNKWPTETPSSTKDSAQCGHRGGYYFNRIIGGANAVEGEFSWQISVQVRSGYSLHHVCGGAILSEHWVVTAGHCVSEVPVSAVSVVAGDHNLYALEGTEQRRSIVNVFTTYFDLATFRNDIALLKVDSPFILKEGSRSSAICLPDKHDKFKGLATVSGWGRLTEEGGSPQSLQQVTLPLVDKYTCHSRYQQVGYSQYLSECQLCAGTPYGGKDACQGDSGGPLICAKDDGKYYLCGIVSWGIGCARAEFPGVYTEVSCFVDWIKNTMQQNGW